MAPSVNYHKGLLNAPGQNNCFLNSAVQVLWHLDIFRRSFRELSGHACMSDSCIFCALKDLFGQLQFSHERALPPDSLRKALAQSFTDQHRFQLGFMDDAAECFENILLRIHFHIAYHEAEDMCNAKHCIPHQKFAMTLVEQSVCGICHATSEPLPFTQMVHYVSASALISQAEQINESSHPDLFGHLLKKAGGMGDIRDCPSMCGAKIQIRRTLINRPEIVSVGIVWDSDRPSLEQIISLLDILRTHLRLSDVFHGSFDAQCGDNLYHQLVGIVTYYGKHYSTFFFHTKLRVWVYFDDANVREVGPHWEQVVEKCRRGRYQPLLLLFATPNGSPVDASNAPKSITLVDRPAMSACNGHDVVGASKPPIQRCSLSPSGSLAMGGRRSLTPSPEKPRSNSDLTQRRAVTPNPEQRAAQANQKPLLSKNDYQNLTQYQETIFNRPSNMCASVEEQCATNKRDSLEKHGGGGGDHSFRKELVRRDSGNWSGDRNSASSSSSTSLENTYHYIIGKMCTRTFAGIPRSPSKNGDLSSGSGTSSGGPADPGYDSFSLSSTDSLPIQQNLKHNFQLAQIPEGRLTPTGSCHLNDENSRVADDCERLCAEVDHLLDRSEQAEDLITALSLCNAAVNKARAAMDAPYSNPQTASFATMKHNACVLRARSLHRRLEEPLHNNLKYGESRHSREGSGCSTRGSGSLHSRQNSRDKGHHSRQNSQELLDMHSYLPRGGTSSSPPPPPSSPSLKPTCESKPTREKLSPSKNIEIYATLPKNKKGLSRSSPKTKNFMEDEEYLMKERPGRSLLGGRSKTAATSKKETEKRARSEERNTKSAKEMTLAVTGTVVNSTKDMEKEQKDSKKQCKMDEKQQNKKQHKIRRKLLMGGLMRRKNRSMPDLREDEGSTIKKLSLPKPTIKETSKDDSMVDSKTAIRSNLNAGYLSEGNLEYAANPNLERSKLMRKSFHGSKVLQFSKVPPPPPLRTTSQLSRFDQHHTTLDESFRNRGTAVVYANSQQCWTQNGAGTEPTSLPFLSPRNTARENNAETDAITYSNGGFLLSQTQSSLPPTLCSSSSSSSCLTAAVAFAAPSLSSNTVVTEALIHHEASFQSLPPSVGEFLSPGHSAIKMMTDDMNFQLPPYPSPIHSTLHSRQASEEFPPPPPTTLPTTFGDGGAESTFLAMLREKCETMAMNAKAEIEHEKKSSLCYGGESWLKELQAKQAERRRAVDSPVTMQNESKIVKDLKYKFEQLSVDEVDYVSKINANDERLSLPTLLPPALPMSSFGSRTEKPEPISSLKSAILNDGVGEDRGLDGARRKSGKKKNVTFCEQVVLVATADDDESDNYIPNPILERVLRTVLRKETNVDGKEHAVHSVVPLKRTDSWRLSNQLPVKSYVEDEHTPDTGSDALARNCQKSPQSRTSTNQYDDDGVGVDANFRLPQNKSSNPLPRTGDTFDEVDCGSPTFISSSQTPNQARSAPYAFSNAYSPTYIPASSLCGAAPNAIGIHRNSIATNANASTSNEYPPDQITSTRESVENTCDGIPESYYEQYAQTVADVNASTKVNVNQVSRKLTDAYPEVTRYSPSACHREASILQKNASGSHAGTYSSYQTTPISHQPEHCSGSSSYQPMSLQYYPSLSRSSPQIQYRDHCSVKGSQPATNGGTGGSSCSSSSLMRHNSNASHYNSVRQISPPHDPRRLPVVSIPSPVTTSSSLLSPSPPPPPLNSRSPLYCHSSSNNEKTIGGPFAYSSNGTGSTSHMLGNEMLPPSKMIPLNTAASPAHHYQSSADASFSVASNQQDVSVLGVASIANQSSITNHHSGYFCTSNSSSSKLPPRTISNHRAESTVSNAHQTFNQHNGPISQISQNHRIPNPRTTCSSPSTPLQISSLYPSGSSSPLYPLVANPYESSVQTHAQRNNSSSNCTTSSSYSVQNACNATHQVSDQPTNGVSHFTQCSQLAVSNATSGLPPSTADANQMQHASNANSHHNTTNPHSPHQYSSNLSNSSSCDNLSCRPPAAISPYLSVPHNSSAAHELHSRCSNSNGGMFSTSYQSSPPLIASSSSASCTYQTANKFGGMSHRSNPPPVYQHPPPPPSINGNGTKCSSYQRVPTPHQQARSDCSNPTTAKYPAYQHPPLPKQVQMQIEAKKTNIAVPGSIGVVPCNLCRKKQISPPSVYCADCNFYISRFRQKI